MNRTRWIAEFHILLLPVELQEILMTEIDAEYATEGFDWRNSKSVGCLKTIDGQQDFDYWRLVCLCSYSQAEIEEVSSRLPILQDRVLMFELLKGLGTQEGVARKRVHISLILQCGNLGVSEVASRREKFTARKGIGSCSMGYHLAWI
eukprot:scaffold313_cov378-Pavlova_lutheri.AAC.5